MELTLFTRLTNKKDQVTLILYAKTQQDMDKIRELRATLDPKKLDQPERGLEQNSTPENTLCLNLDHLLPKKKR